MDNDARGLHRQAWDLIPWVVNGSASDGEVQLVAAHVARCPDCRDELAFHRRLHAGISGDLAEPPSAEKALARLWAGIERAEGESAGVDHGAAPPVAPRREGRTRWLAAAVVVQAIGLGALGGAMGWQTWARHDPGYETLTQPAVDTSATIRLVVSPELRLGELRAMLARNGLVVAQTSADGAILGVAVVAGSSSSREERLASLRAEAGVLLAEPIQRDGDASR